MINRLETLRGDRNLASSEMSKVCDSVGTALLNDGRKDYTSNCLNCISGMELISGSRKSKDAIEELKSDIRGHTVQIASLRATMADTEFQKKYAVYAAIGIESVIIEYENSTDQDWDKFKDQLKRERRKLQVLGKHVPAYVDNLYAMNNHLKLKVCIEKVGFTIVQYEYMLKFSTGRNYDFHNGYGKVTSKNDKMRLLVTCTDELKGSFVDPTDCLVLAVQKADDELKSALLVAINNEIKLIAND
jgi:hypothetical protein